jgi:lysine 2,3-aminomutase
MDGQDEALARVAARYAVAITPAMEALIDDDDDPIALQFQPDPRELLTAPDERADPIGDAAHSPVEGIVHRYRDRCLLKVVSACAVYCRFCFRREMVGPGRAKPLSPKALDRAIDYIDQHTELWEIILTGGDPFVLSPRRARTLTQRLSAIPHVRVLRWHTRIPIVDPARVSEEFADSLCTDDATTYVVVHANHPRELTCESKAALKRLAERSIPLLSQSVLLKGVNDDPGTLEALMRALVEARVKPYYLHHLDPAPGTSHFRIPIERGQAIVQAMRERASGLCQPAYVLDIPGGHGKASLAPCAARREKDGWRLRGREGVWRPYSTQTD